MEHSDKFQNELKTNEILLWTGQPDANRLVGAQDAFLIPFSLLWGGFALFWEFSVVSGGAPFFFMLWGVPFVLIGLYMIFGRFIAKKWQRQRTWHAITNRRILTLHEGFSQQLTSVPITRDLAITKQKRPDASGSLFFGLPPMLSPFQPGSFSQQNRGNPFAAFGGDPPGLIDIPDVDEVEKKIEFIRLQTDAST